MIRYGLLVAVALTCENSLIASGALISPLMKLDPISSRYNLYKNGGEASNSYDYAIVKREPQDNVQDIPDSKERRSQMGSSFIRFGRGRNIVDQRNLENADYSPISGENSRIARGRSDVIIRFGRAGSKNSPSFVGRGSSARIADLLKILEHKGHPKAYGETYGENNLRGVNVATDDLGRLAFICSKAIAENSTGGDVFLSEKLSRICGALGLGMKSTDDGDLEDQEDDDEDNNRRPRNKVVRVLEDNNSSGDSIKRE